MRPAPVTRNDQARAFVGLRYRASGRYVVTTAGIRAYAAAVGSRHAAHFSAEAAAELGFAGLVAPPMFATLPWLRAAREALDVLLPGDRSPRILHAGQTVHIGRLLVAGDVVTTELHFDSYERFPDYHAMTVTAALRDEAGDVLQAGTATLLSDDPVAGPRRFPLPPRWRLPGVIESSSGAGEPVETERIPRPRVDAADLSVGSELPRRATAIGRRELLRYASLTGETDVAGRFAPVLPATVPCMMRLALAAEFVTAWSGDPAAARAYRAEFTHHCPTVSGGADEAVEFRGRVGGWDPGHRTAAVSLDGCCRGRRLFARAAAEVDLGAPDCPSRLPPGA